MIALEVPLWLDILGALLLVASGVFSLTGALGILRMKDFFMRVHASTLAYTFGAWCVALTSILYFSTVRPGIAVHAWIIVVVLAITVPVTTVLLARAQLFRSRQAGHDVPEPLGSRRGSRRVGRDSTA